jgi:4-alpha-glucanotransferase
VSEAGRRNLPPFQVSSRASGLLLHVTSLPTPYGIGDLGPAATAWIDQLCDAGQSWWQALPLGPTGYGNSPYQSLSSFAGNALLISPDWLIEEGLLGREDCVLPSFSQTAVDYDTVIPFKQKLIEKAWMNFAANGSASSRAAFDQFRHEQAHWLEDYSLFRALKIHFHGAYYLDWPTELVQRVPKALLQARRDLKTQVDQVCFAQFLLFSQGERLQKYARAKGICLIGDLPFFVSPDSSDVWANPELFLLDDRRKPRFVAGVPPDYFSAQGQRWGNPIYNWEALRETGYRWCINRLRALLAHVDVIRLDHFRAFAAAWHVAASAPTAQSGQWLPGPGADFFDAVKKELGGLPFVAEDLGVITADVNELRNQFQIPGTRVLQFAFDGTVNNPFLPNKYSVNSVVYTGTHDNPTSREWYDELPPSQQRNLWRYLGSVETNSRDVAWHLIRLAWLSPAALAIAPLQDLLNLGVEGRMNVPGRAEGNWSWRCSEQFLASADYHWLRDLTKTANRCSYLSKPANAMAEAAI